jgi:hypothetical protein
MSEDGTAMLPISGGSAMGLSAIDAWRMAVVDDPETYNIGHRPVDCQKTHR